MIYLCSTPTPSLMISDFWSPPLLNPFDQGRKTALPHYKKRSCPDRYGYGYYLMVLLHHLPRIEGPAVYAELPQHLPPLPASQPAVRVSISNYPTRHPSRRVRMMWSISLKFGLTTMYSCSCWNTVDLTEWVQWVTQAVNQLHLGLGTVSSHSEKILGYHIILCSYLL